jgi:hypothetical protein
VVVGSGVGGGVGGGNLAAFAFALLPLRQKVVKINGVGGLGVTLPWCREFAIGCGSRCAVLGR